MLKIHGESMSNPVEYCNKKDQLPIKKNVMNGCVPL